mgnify:CR=1 FL=1
MRRCESRVIGGDVSIVSWIEFLFWIFCGLNSWNRNGFCGIGYTRERRKGLFRPFTINGPNGIFRNSLGFKEPNSYKWDLSKNCPFENVLALLFIQISLYKNNQIIFYKVLFWAII